MEPFLLVHRQLERKDGVTNVIAQRFERLRVPPELLAPEARSFR